MINVKTVLDVCENVMDEDKIKELLMKYCTCASIENVDVVELSKALLSSI
jgi:hypothetical protein